MIDSCAVCGDPDLAVKVMDEMPSRGLQPDVLCYNALIAAVPKDQCVSVLGRMADAEVAPNAGTHITVLKSVTRDGEGLDEGFVNGI